MSEAFRRVSDDASVEPRIRIKHVNKRFYDIAKSTEIVALQDIQLEIGPSEFLTILVPLAVASPRCSTSSRDLRRRPKAGSI